MGSYGRSTIWPGVVVGVVLVASTTFLVARVVHASNGTAGNSPAQTSAAGQTTPSPNPRSSSPTSTLPAGNWKLSWHDEFSTTAALRNWSFVTGNLGGSNLHQLQWYDRSNAAVRGGNLVITAAADGGGHQCWNGSCHYTSVRMQTSFAQAYGLFEARIKMPNGSGLWPAFWMVGDNYNQVFLPKAGEIDVAEISNLFKPNVLTAFAHGPVKGSRELRFQAQVSLTHPLSAGYHVYAVKWTRNRITWLVDGNPYGHLDKYRGWPFNHPFNIILDLAVGGSWPGPPKASTHFPATMDVDWIRVYRNKS